MRGFVWVNAFGVGIWLFIGFLYYNESLSAWTTYLNGITIGVFSGVFLGLLLGDD